ncbi:MAG: addiction module protein [Ignavibacteria bacterium]|nr:addiction module protein [Ignavibacteria bacterium]
MNAKSIVQTALSLSPAERILIIEAISKSLSEPNADIEKYWEDEVEKRFQLFIDGKVKTIVYNDIVKK